MKDFVIVEKINIDVKWYSKAAEQGWAPAQYAVGYMYSQGKGVPQNDFEAVKWYSKAAEQGYPNAQYDLALKYENGLGVNKDYNEAIKWYGKAANQGHTNAKKALERLR